MLLKSKMSQMLLFATLNKKSCQARFSNLNSSAEMKSEKLKESKPLWRGCPNSKRVIGASQGSLNITEYFGLKRTSNDHLVQPPLLLYLLTVVTFTAPR